MVITPHMLAGAAIGIHSENIGTAFLFGLASHYLLDLLPHWEYLSEARISKAADALKIFADFLVGFPAVLFLTWDSPDKLIIVSAILGSLLPDVLCFLANMYEGAGSRFLKAHFRFHYKLHYFKYLSFWQGLPAALIVVIISIFVLWG